MKFDEYWARAARNVEPMRYPIIIIIYICLFFEPDTGNITDFYAKPCKIIVSTNFNRKGEGHV